MKRLLIATFAAATAGLGMLAGSAQGADVIIGPMDATAQVSAVPPLGAVTKRINVDGAPVDVTVSATNVGLLLTTGGPPQWPTSVRVDLARSDGEDLPLITAVRVKLERIRPPMRIFKSTLTRDYTYFPPNTQS